MSEPSENQILEALEKSGYLFEQEVADRLEAMDFHVDTGWAFRDQDEDKSRELDVRGIMRVLHDEKNKLAIFVEVLVECKAFESPMVFLQRAKNIRELEHPDPREYLFPLRHFRKQVSTTSYQDVPTFLHLNLRQTHYYHSETLKANQFSKIVHKNSQWSANHDGVYDSLVLPLAKALESRRKEISPIVGGKDWSHVWLFFPMVVLRKGLFSLEVGSKPLMPKRQGRVSFVRHLESGNVKGFYLTDFVTVDHLEHYVRKEIFPFSAHVVDLCTKDPQLFRQKNA